MSHLALLFLLIRLGLAAKDATIEKIWGAKTTTFTLFGYVPPFLLNAYANLTYDELMLMEAQREHLKEMYRLDPETRSSDVLDWYEQVGAPNGAAACRIAIKGFEMSLKRYDSITEQKLENFLEEFAEAMFRRTEYHTAYALFHYLHLRNGWGPARRLVREYFPQCEMMAKLKQIQTFYEIHKGDKPDSLFTLASFMKLLLWLQFHHAL